MIKSSSDNTSYLFWISLGVCMCPETSGAVRRAGGNFKEKLREHGGLDAVFEVAMNCNSDLEV